MTFGTRFVRLLALAAFVLSSTLATAEAALIRFGADLGPETAAATGSGSVLVEYDDVGNTLQIAANWSGLSGTTTVAHIHCCVVPAGTAGVAVTPDTLPGFPAGLMAGAYESPLIDLDDPASFTTTFLNSAGGTTGGATSELLAAMTSGTAYFNIHTSTFPGGEIRGFLHKVPEPGTLALGLVALAGLVAARRTRR